VLRYVWIALALAACKYPDPGVGDAAIGEDAPIDADLINGAYVVAHTSLDGASTKVVVVRTVDTTGALDLSGARTFGAGTRVFMAGGKVFVATDRTIRRFAVVDYSLVEEGTPISFLTTNVMTFSDTFSVLDPTHAWYFDHETFEAYALDLDAMTSSTAIFFSSLNFSEHVVHVTGAYAVGDVLYVPFYFLAASQPTFIESEMYVGQFSLSGLQPTTTSATALRSGRCARAHPFARLGDDTLLFLGDSGSLYDLVTPQISPNCLVRIDPATDPNVIDGAFYSNMDDLTSPELSATAPVQFGTQVITWARDASHFATQAEWEMSSHWTPQITDATSLVTEQLTDEVATDGAPGQTFFVDGRPFFQIPDVAGSALWTEDSGYQRRVTVPGKITLIERVR
jgi:hypothetical protein